MSPLRRLYVLLYFAGIPVTFGSCLPLVNSIDEAWAAAFVSLFWPLSMLIRLGAHL